MSKKENHYISIIYYKLIDIHIDSGCIQEFRQNLTDHVFTINKRELNIVKIGKRKTKENISTREISKRDFALFCTPILLYRAGKGCYLQKVRSLDSLLFNQMRSTIEMANLTNV